MSELPPVVIVCPNLASNSLGRALLLAQLVSQETSVRIVGVCRGPQVWRPAQGSSIEIESFSLSRQARYSPAAVRWLKRALRDDLVVVSKPLVHSLGLALAAGARTKRMVIDIDDWETGFSQRDADLPQAAFARRWSRTRSYTRRLGLNAFVLTRALEEIARRSPFHVVSNRWLRRRFGGEILYHVRDPEHLDPARATPPADFVLDKGRPWVAFVGTPRPHKGLENLVEAIARLDGPAAPGLLLMGAENSSSATLQHARQRLGARFASLPQFASVELASHLALADIIAIPSLNVPSAWGQIPAKLFDALAMAKPVVVSDVNDMAEIAEGCGLSFAAGDTSALSGAISRLAADADLRQQLGQAGRAKFLARFTHNAGREVLLKVLRAAAA